MAVFDLDKTNVDTRICNVLQEMSTKRIQSVLASIQRNSWHGKQSRQSFRRLVETSKISLKPLCPGTPETLLVTFMIYKRDTSISTCQVLINLKVYLINFNFVLAENFLNKQCLCKEGDETVHEQLYLLHKLLLQSPD